MEESNPFRRLDAKLRATAKSLSRWSAKFIGNVKLQILMANDIILRLDKSMDSRELSVEERGLRRLLKKKLLGLASLDRTLVRQRSRVLWLREGDACTKFFHLHARHRRRKNFIDHLIMEGTRLTEHVDKANAVDDFFDNLLGVDTDRPFSVELDYLDLPTLDLHHLEATFYE